MKLRVGSQENTSMCILKGILDTISRDKNMNSKRAVCFIQLYCPVFILARKHLLCLGRSYHIRNPLVLGNFYCVFETYQNLDLTSKY